MVLTFIALFKLVNMFDTRLSDCIITLKSTAALLNIIKIFKKISFNHKNNNMVFYN